MRSDAILPGCALVALLVAGAGAVALADASTGTPRPTVRVGTFDSRGVALAYGRSDRPDCLMAEVAELRKQVEQARQAGDAERVKELEARGPALQEQIHRQVFSGAPIDEILALIEDELPAIAAAAKVDLIVQGVLHRGPGVEVVDITTEMCAPFGPDEQTRKMIKEIVAQPPVPESELRHDH